MSDFNQILHQKLQTNHQISIKSVGVGKSYNEFNEVTRKHEVLTILATFIGVIVTVQKSLLKISSTS